MSTRVREITDSSVSRPLVSSLEVTLSGEHKTKIRVKFRDGIQSMGGRILISISTLQYIVVFSFVYLMALTGAKVFEPWQQVTTLWDSGWPILYFIDNFHFERYLASYPGLLLEELFPGIGFSIYIAIFVAMNVILFRRVHKGFAGFPPSWFAYAILLFAHLAMNGRGPIGWFGWLLSLYLHARFIDPQRSGVFFTIKVSFLLLISILFSSVSSGVFIVVFMSNALLIALALRNYKRTANLRVSGIFYGFFAYSIIGFAFYRATLYAIDAVLKILNFFGSYTEIIQHGVGLLSGRFDAFVMYSICLILLMILLLLWKLINTEVAPVLWVLFIFSIVGGGFGFTTLTLNIPVVLVLFGSFLRVAYKQPTLRTISP